MKAEKLSKAQKRLQELILSKKSYYVKRSDYEKLEQQNKEQANILQWCYNYVRKKEESDEKQRLIEELKKMGAC